MTATQIVTITLDPTDAPTAALAVLHAQLHDGHPAPLAALAAAGDLVCAECGTTHSPAYVATILDTADPKHTRTEVCLECHLALAAS